MNKKPAVRFKIKHDLTKQYKEEYLNTADDVSSMAQGVDRFITWLGEKGYEIKKKINGVKIDNKVKTSDN